MLLWEWWLGKLRGGVGGGRENGEGEWWGGYMLGLEREIVQVLYNECFLHLLLR